MKYTMKWKDLLSERTLVPRESEPSNWQTNYPINAFEKDYKVIVSSAAFRRLQDKTQVFPLDKSDFVRTRLTHSIEVSTIAKQLGVMVTSNNTKYPIDDFQASGFKMEIPTVLACAGLLHDLGNPPFGHFGEVVIGDWFKEQLGQTAAKDFAYKGQPIGKIINDKDPKTRQMYNDLCHFEGNAQAFRILSKISKKPKGYDINLSYAVLNSLIKYPCSSLEVDKESKDVTKHKLGYYLAEQETFEQVCSVTGTKQGKSYFRHPLTYLMEAADDIAYATSDLEDALKKGLFNIDQFIQYFQEQIRFLPADDKREKTEELIQNLTKRIKALQKNNLRTRENELIEFQKWSIFVKGWMMYVVAYSFSKNYKDIIAGDYKHDLFYEGFHSYSIQILKNVMAKFVFDSGEIVKLELSAHKILTALLSDFIRAVIHWESGDSQFQPTKTDFKLINIISENYKQDYLKAKTDDEYYNLYLRFLMVTDFISGMTDSYAKTLYQELNGIL